MNGVDMNGEHQASEHIGQLSSSVITTNNNSSLSVVCSCLHCLPEAASSVSRIQHHKQFYLIYDVIMN